MESYFELVVETLTAAGYRWYETANFCRAAERAGGRDLRSRHNLGYWLGHDYLGLGVGAVSTIENRRWRNAPSLRGYLEALEAGRRPPRELEELSQETRDTERVMLGLRLDEPVALAGLEHMLDAGELGRLERLGLAERQRRRAHAHLARPLPRRRRHGGAARLSARAASTARQSADRRARVSSAAPGDRTGGRSARGLPWRG